MYAILSEFQLVWDVCSKSTVCERARQGFSHLLQEELSKNFLPRLCQKQCIAFLRKPSKCSEDLNETIISKFEFQTWSQAY